MGGMTLHCADNAASIVWGVVIIIVFCLRLILWTMVGWSMHLFDGFGGGKHFTEHTTPGPIPLNHGCPHMTAVAIFGLLTIFGFLINLFYVIGIVDLDGCGDTDETVIKDLAIANTVLGGIGLCWYCGVYIVGITAIEDDDTTQ